MVPEMPPLHNHPFFIFCLESNLSSKSETKHVHIWDKRAIWEAASVLSDFFDYMMVHLCLVFVFVQ